LLFSTGSSYTEPCSTCFKMAKLEKDLTGSELALALENI
jgi:hypothetical protein